MRGAGFVLLLLLLAGASVVEGQVRGRVVDLRTGAGIAGASVHVFAPGVEREVLTQANGAYAVAGLAAAEYRVVVRHPGYGTADLRVVLAGGSDVVVDVPLEVQPIPVGRIVIPVRRTRTQYLTAPGAQDSLIAAIESRQNGTLRTGPTSALTDLVLADVDETPSDPAGGQHPHSLHIWGSSAERGRILLDGVTLNAPLHLGAILPPLDPGLLAGIEMRTGGASARYDGGTNYIVEYLTRAPAGDELHAWGALDLLASRIGIEAPIGSGSVLLGARRVNDEAVDALIDGAFDYEYGDVLARGAADAGQHGSLTAVVMATREMIRIPRDQSDDEASWRNLASVISWRADEHSAAPSLSASFSRGIVDLPLLSAPDGHLKATLDRASFTAAHEWSVDDLDIDAGIELEHLRLTRVGTASADPALPGLQGPVTCTPSLPCASAGATTAALFSDVAWQAASRIALRAGLRTVFDTDAARVDLLPRVALSWLGSASTAATLSFGRFSQLAVMEPFAGDAVFATTPLQTATGHATQLELRLAHRTDRVAIEATGFLRRNEESPSQPTATTSPGAEVSWAILMNGNSISGGYSLLARRSSVTDSLPGQRLQHLVFMGVGTGAGPVSFDVSAVYGAGVPLTSIVLDRPATQLYGESPTDPVPPADPGPYVRLDAVLSGDWSLELRDRDVHVSPYVKLINAFSRRGALFYYREGGGTDLQPLSTLPMMPVLGVRWAF